MASVTSDDFNPFYTAIHTLTTHNIPLEKFIHRAMLEPGINETKYVTDFYQDLPKLLNRLLHDERTERIMADWIKQKYMGTLTSQVQAITRPKQGFHFNTGSITVEKIKECTINKIADMMQVHAPDVWELVGNLMQADPAVVQHRKREQQRREKEREKREKVQDQGLDPGKKSTTVVNEHEAHVPQLTDNDKDEPDDIEDQLENQRLLLLCIKQVTCISIMMQATNQRCNALQSLVGIFLQSCNVADQTRNFLAHLGVSVSVTSINRAIDNLSKQASQEIRHLGSTLLASYAYDNLDMDLTHSTPTLETSTKDTLVHLTTASMFPLHPMTMKKDLEHSTELRQLALCPPIPSTLSELLDSFPTKYNKFDHQDRSIQDRFNHWKFISDLLTYGPPGFQQFKEKLGEPDEIDCIPLIKTKQVPLKASKTGPNTPAKNATVLEEFFRQSNVGEKPDKSHPPAHTPVDPGNTVLPIFGDLLTGQHLHSLQDSRVPDETPVTRFEPLLFAHGWFHTRMACANAIWRRHIKDFNPDRDSCNLMKYIMQI